MQQRVREATGHTIDDVDIASVIARLQQGRKVHLDLPLGGVLHIDRPLPFMVLYRKPVKRNDAGTELLVRGEASYLLASDSPKQRQGLASLVRQIMSTQSEKYNAFLIIEIWSSGKSTADCCDSEPEEPRFRVMTSGSRPPTYTVDALAKALKSVSVHKKKPVVSVDLDQGRTPRGLSPLLTIAETRKLNGYFIGLEVSPCFRDPVSGELYPIVLRALHRGFARALKRAFFEFSHTQTTYRPLHYHVLGRRAVVRSVWEVDRKLAAISRAFDLILQATPINIEKSWSRFKSSRFDVMPVLYYRPLSVDPEILKRELFGIHIDRIEDPTLAFLFRQKRKELDRQLSMLLDRGKEDFLYGSLQLYGRVDEPLYYSARQLLERLAPHRQDESVTDIVSAADFAQRAHEEVELYRRVYPDISSTVQIRDYIIGLMVSKGNLFIGRNSRVSRSRMNALIEHEVGTHILTYINGTSQPFHQLYCGLAGYEELQEGLAVLAEYFTGGLSGTRMRLLAGRVIAAWQLIDGATFVDTYRSINREYGFNQRTAYTIAIRIFRAGGLTKDAVYLRGLIELLDYLKNGGDLFPLFVGKIAIEHVPLIRELQYREVLRMPPLTPGYLDRSDFIPKMNMLKKGLSPIELVERR